MKRFFSLRAGLSFLPLLLAAAPALAQVEPAPVAPGAPIGGSELSSVLPSAGQLTITVPLAINLSSNRAAEPISIPLDIYYGLDDDFTLGITHSGATVQGVSPYPVGPGLCLTSDSCGDKIYNNIGFDALYRLVPGALQVVGHGGIDLNSLDPAWVSLRVGALFKAPLGSNLALAADPRIGIALTKRDEFNEDYISLPLAIQFTTGPGVRLAGQTGIAGPLDGFGDFFRGWLGFFAALGVNEKIDAFASFTFDNLYGKGGGGDARSLVLGANIRP
jgi:hypothetical protein